MHNQSDVCRFIGRLSRYTMNKSFFFKVTVCLPNKLPLYVCRAQLNLEYPLYFPCPKYLVQQTSLCCIRCQLVQVERDETLVVVAHPMFYSELHVCSSCFRPQLHSAIRICTVLLLPSVCIVTHAYILDILHNTDILYLWTIPH